MITSSGNSKIKLTRLLLNDKKEREKRDLFVLEGVRLAEECFSAGFRPNLVLYSQQLSKRGHKVLERLKNVTEDVYEVDIDLLDRVSDTRTSQGLLMVVKIPQIDLPHEVNYVLALDRISDPGNLGTILRTAAACSVQTVLLTPGSADVFNPKVVRSGMGAHFRIPIRIMDDHEIKTFCKTNVYQPLVIFSSDVSGGVSSWDLDLRQPLCLVIGSEAAGVTAGMAAISDARIHIPMNKDTESFNTAVAAGIFMYEVLCQRKNK